MMKETIKHYLTAFENIKTAGKAGPTWLAAIREEAMRSFETQGFPTSKQEAWRYTDVMAVRETSWNVTPHPAAVPRAVLADFRKRYPGHVLFFVNGCYEPAYSSIPEGVQAFDLSMDSQETPGWVQEHLGRLASPKQNAFVALNTAFFSKGLCLLVPDNRVIEEPLQLIFLSSTAENSEVYYPRILWLLGKHSQLIVSEAFHSLTERTSFTNAVAEVVLEEGARLKRFKSQEENSASFHIETVQVVQQKTSLFASLAVSSGAKWMRDECRLSLAGASAETDLKGLFLAGNGQMLDHHTFIDHQQPDGKSQQIFKGLVAGKSRGVFSGNVLVRRGAHGTDAHQTNKNLILSDDAKVDTQPQLEIFEDDVKCSHGAAVGQLEEDSIFYLKSRGIGEQKARHMLAEGFAKELIGAAVPPSIRDMLLQVVSDKLDQQLVSEKDGL